MSRIALLCIVIAFTLSIFGCSFALVSLRYDTNNYDCPKPRLDSSDQGNSEEIKAELDKK